jgi:diaminopimelate epimerase
MTCENGVVHCTKHEGAGNDFIVVLDPDDRLRLTVAQIALLCDRQRGVGADGLIRVGPGRDGCDLAMELRNADGGEAEMSGNGIRCLAQAAVDGGLVTPPHFTVATAAGARTVEFVPGESPGRARASVDMGPVTLGPETAGDGNGRRGRRADVGNPHLVLLGDEVGSVDVSHLGPRFQAEYADGINVEWIAPARDEDGDLLELRVWERGAGETLACGTGSVAAAAVARDWDAVGPGPVRVRNPGGMLEVVLGARPGDPAVLAGPVRKVADLEIHPGMLL